jgi:hypothetical protein
MPHQIIAVLLGIAFFVQIEIGKMGPVTVNPERLPPRMLASQLLEIARVMNWPDRAGSPDGRVLREVRMTDNEPMNLMRVPLLRLIDVGQGFEAQFFVWWRSRPQVIPESGPGTTCSPGNVCVQVVSVLAKRDWNQIGDRLLALPECRPPWGGPGFGVVIDAGTLHMDLFDRGVSRVYYCSAPGYAPNLEVRETYQALWDRELWGASIEVRPPQ